ncbi:MAG: hypothetical protein CME62_12230 [Halobacteriovoraceae bacterium]|nr:hypothetical protein [Halobacteriovoraceae bacterium]|tara:strand:- start:3542 stop:4762 length:1221 start_codon:yes stop_codon:yes gene_type:complete
MKILFLITILFSTFTHARVYNHSEWMKVFEEKDLNTQIELLQVQTARAQIDESLGRIIPSLNIETVVNTAISGPLGLLSGMSNLLGFMMPSRWYKWNESKMYYQAQKHAYVSMRGNLLLMADELYLSLKKAYLTRDVLNLAITDLESLSRSIQFRERIGELPKGTYARIESKLYSLQNDKINIDSIVQVFLIEMNKLINTSESPELTTIDYQTSRESNVLDWNRDNVISASSELQSLDDLIVASKYSRRARFWSFLDISGEGFGLGYFARNQISTYKRDEIEIRREQQLQALVSKYQAVSVQVNKVEAQQALLNKALRSTSNRREQILIDYKLLGVLDIDDFIEILDDNLTFSTQNIATTVQNEYLQATKERLTKAGIYNNLDKNVPARDTSRLTRSQRKEDRYLP